jgi:hypothetical protein
MQAPFVVRPAVGVVMTTAGTKPRPVHGRRGLDRHEQPRIPGYAHARSGVPQLGSGMP